MKEYQMLVKGKSGNYGIVARIDRDNLRLSTVDSCGGTYPKVSDYLKGGISKEDLYKDSECWQYMDQLKVADRALSIWYLSEQVKYLRQNISDPKNPYRFKLRSVEIIDLDEPWDGLLEDLLGVET